MLHKINELEKLIQLRTPKLKEDISLYLMVADELEKTNLHELIKRAAFIRKQCSDDKAESLFNENRESWGIPNFNERLVTVDDFKRGFLYKFRDHTTWWSDSQKAREWFLNSFEARFVQVYEFWSFDRGKNQMIQRKTGDYKSILKSLLAEGDYEVLTSPTFSKAELDDFIKTHRPLDGDFSIDEIISEYIHVNPNY